MRSLTQFIIAIVILSLLYVLQFNAIKDTVNDVKQIMKVRDTEIQRLYNLN